MKLTLFLVPLLLVSLTSAAFICEKFQKARLKETNEVLTCFMGILQPDKPKTHFPMTYFTSAAGLTLQGNKNVIELPENLRTLGNVENYDASSCAITAIKKANFISLKKLKRVWLSNNAIDTVNSDTFEDNPLLAEIALDNNKLKIVNGQCFQNLRNLQKVTLSGNPCINANFDNPNKIQELSQTVTKLCKYCEAGADATELNDCQTNLQLISDKLAKCKIELEAPATTVAPTINQASVEFCKIQLESQQKAHEQVISVLQKVNEELRKEKQALVIENEKNKKNAEVLQKQLSIRNQNCEHTTTASESLDYSAFGN